MGWTIIPDLTRTRNCSYLGSDAVVDKYKFTLLSQTLKVEVNKVVLLYSSIAQEPRYGHFVIWTIRERSSIMSARFGGLNQNADTADAGEGGGGVSDQMLTLLTLGSGGMKMLGLRAEIKRK